MKFKFTCTEMFQTVEGMIECETYEELSDAIRMTRNAIKYACTDIKEKDTQKKTKKVKQDSFVPASEKQLNLLKKLYGDELEIMDVDKLSAKDASILIDEYYKNKKQIN